MLLPLGVLLDPRVVRVVVIGGRLVPGIVDAEMRSVALPWLNDIVVVAIVEGATMVPGVVLVYVSSWPTRLAEMAVPMPLLVHGVGIARIAVFGLPDVGVP